MRALEAYILAQRQGTPLSHGKHWERAAAPGKLATPRSSTRFPCRREGLVVARMVLSNLELSIARLLG